MSFINDCDRKESAAVEIAIKAGTLQTCEYHRHFIFEGDQSLESAIDLGNREFAKGAYRDLFNSDLEMTDFIKSVVEDNNGTRKCSACVKMLADD